MENTAITRINTWIRYCFYAILFTVPLIMHPYTYELFEFNKMWVVFGLALIILLLWVSKITITKRFTIRRTPLDIPILLFLGAQTLSTMFSTDPYVSFWGYYSRFNGGLLSFITYVFLYYAYATHVVTDGKERGQSASMKMILVTLISGGLVALWGFPSHFGADFTCLVFRGQLDTSCWTAAFHPTVRMFSTMGQPNWLAALLSVLIPLAVAYGLVKLRNKPGKPVAAIAELTRSITPLTIGYIVLSLLFYIDLVYTDSKSGFAAFWAGNIVFFLLVVLLLWKERAESFFAVLKHKIVITLILTNVLFLTLNFLQGIPLHQFDKYTLPTILNKQSAPQAPAQPQAEQATPQGPALEVGGSDSGRIRKIVWTGAIKLFQQHPIVGTGPETFAYAYYNVRPEEHNMTSEWDFLYNKAHNEYLNYLATSGILGLGTYLAFIAMFFWTVYKLLWQKGHRHDHMVLACALLGGYISILISNFFGFSVVIINLFLFLIPLWLYDVTSHELFSSVRPAPAHARINAGNATLITMYVIIVLFLEIILYRYWVADQHYALGNNLDKVGEYVRANPELIEAVRLRPGEDTFKDELSINLSTLALALSEQKQTTQAAQFIEQAKQLSDMVIAGHPNNVVYWKSRTRVLYALSKIDPRFTQDSLRAIDKAHELAPSDAKIMYNLGLLYDQAGEADRAREALRETGRLKPDYRDAFYTLALLDSREAKKAREQGNIARAQELTDEAKKALTYTLTKITDDDQQAKDLLNSLD